MNSLFIEASRRNQIHINWKISVPEMNLLNGTLNIVLNQKLINK